MKVVRIEAPKNFIVISDVHLRNPHDALTKLFINTLQEISLQVDTIFLLGDIFDFIAIHFPFCVTLWKNVFDTFKSLKQKGIKIYFLEGNHDFGFEHFKTPWLNDCFNGYGDFIIEFTHAKLGQVHLRHGDNVVCEKNYLKFRRLVKNKLFQQLAFWLCPGKLVDLFFSWYATVSRKQSSQILPSQSYVNLCVARALKGKQNTKTSQAPCVLVMGHIHILQNTLIPLPSNTNIHLLVGPDWMTQPNYLKYSNEGFERIYF